MKIGAKWDRISGCYNNNYSEIFLNGLPYKPKHNASSIVDFPAPFSPMISVVGCLSSCISVKLFPVERKFFHLTYLKLIKEKPPNFLFHTL